MAHVTWNFVAYWSGMVRKIYETRTLEIRHLVRLFSKWSENLTEVSRPFPSVQLPLCQNESKYENEFRVQVFLSCRSTSLLYERFCATAGFETVQRHKVTQKWPVTLATTCTHAGDAFVSRPTRMNTASLCMTVLRGTWSKVTNEQSWVLALNFWCEQSFVALHPWVRIRLKKSNSCCGAVSNDCLIVNPS